ncbi:MAG: hypothetical protein RIE06_06920 [Roseibium album]|uniref:Tox-MPTase3 domain-containing protein n=1 Tax=Roseibium album TaxID=311410 RepID=A0A0M6ZH07_9HYPH|nr:MULTISPECIES: hypothetical protein [Stappiaceae]MBG6144568.1 hypothetical protein [Labrenzia sp. EL_142]CTQ61396.1 hypothetical protein LA5094_04175 [Roseibium album]CTQ68207.1 hypothetical protein LA5096_01715 [Roseibium album]CTQ79327.1 hypothetical protein LA5095_04736 [Roseibium album]
MIISAADQTRYPRFTRYVRRSLPSIANIASMRRAFRRYAQMNSTTLRRALAWGNQPTLNITAIASPAGSFINGEFTPNSSSNEIRLNEILVTAYENGTPAHLAFTRNAAGQRMPRVGVTILHELVHWGDDQDGVDYPGEEGELFEQAVYGRNTEG